jgi:hypothetical protein
MSRTKDERTQRLLPGGVPRYIRCYDYNHGGMNPDDQPADRYTVVFSGAAVVERAPGCVPHYPYRAMSANPCHPQGFGQWCSNEGQPVDTHPTGGKGRRWPPPVGRKCNLGMRIRFEDLPEECRRLVLADYREVWKIVDG